MAEWLRTSILGLLLVLSSSLAMAAPQQPPPFSATAVQKAPQSGEQTAKMYVGENAVRTEYSRDGQRYVEIVFRDSGRRVLLMPQRGMYMEQAPSGAPPAQAARDREPAANPCEGMPNATCKKLGTEKVDGREAVKWEISTQQDGNTMRSLHWIDTERQMPIREYFPDGTVRELNFLGETELRGRQVEKWESVMTGSDGNTRRSVQWYDPQLQIAIREEMDGGYVRELRHIEVGSQPDHLFQVPNGFRKVQPQQQQRQPRRAPQGRQPQGGYSPGYR